MGQTTTIRTETQRRADIYQRVTDSIVAAIEAGAGNWRMPWHSGMDGLAPVLPVNVATGRSCRGVKHHRPLGAGAGQHLWQRHMGTYR